GIARVLWLARSVHRTLRTRDETPPSPLLPRLDPLWQPLVLGTRILAPILLAGLLFVVDVGLPLAIASVPAAVTGGDGEAVVTANPQSLLFSSTAMARANAARHAPAIDEVVAEVLVPTVLDGLPLLVRGGDWGSLASFHGLRITEGSSPLAGGVALGERLAARRGLGVGDTLVLPATTRPYAAALTVSGIYDGPGLLADEAVLPLADAQDLAGLRPDTVTVVRARPDTPQAMDALTRRDAEVAVTRVEVFPESPPAGTLATIRVTAVNLGAQAGTRILDVRVDGRSVGRVQADVPGWGERTFDLRFVAPPGRHVVEVNPTVEVTPAPGALRLSAAPLQFDDEPLRVQAHDPNGGPIGGVRVRLHPDAEAAAQGAGVLAEATTDSSGTATFRTVGPGAYVAATDAASPAAVQVLVGAAEDRDRARLVVQRLWTVPPQPTAGELATAYASVVNLGGREAEHPVRITLDGGIIHDEALRVPPGATAVAEALFSARSGNHTLAAGAQELTLRIQPPRNPDRNPATGDDARPSTGLRKSAADAVLGDARRALLGLGGTALASSVVLLGLSAARTVQGRRHVLPALWALGLTPEDLRRRAVLEGAALGAVAAIASLAAGWLLFSAAALAQWPLAFGHALVNPIGPLFAVQVVAAFAAVCAACAHIAVARLLEPERLRRPGVDEPPLLEPMPVEALLR
ncbi:MAG TPA: hypothetical protein VFH47_01295, partial [Candidatus Thermoplasmatota archaeon]|nr:hypothetical protein [Candidatus Thermoplasmatota archaeon]